MGKLKIKHIDIPSLADGSTYENEWTADEDYTIKYILIRRADGQPFTATTVTFFIDQQAITDDKAPAAIFGTDILNALPINESLLKDHKFKYSVKNQEGTTITVYIDLILERTR